MKTPLHLPFVPPRLAGLAAVLVCLSGGAVVRAADITLTGTGAFAGTSGWSNGEAPSAGNNYFTGNFNVQTEFNTSNYSFAGDSLTIGPGTGLLVIRTTNTVTVADLRLNNGGVQNWVGFTPRLAGAITLTGYGQISPSQGRTLNVSATIGGTGELRAKAGLVILAAANTYSGGTLIQADGNYGSSIDARSDGAFGTGNVTLQLGTTLKLSAGATNNYIANSASLIFASNLAAGSVTLSFVGTDTLAALSFDGGSTWAANGTWGGVGSGALHENAIFSGSGLLQVGAAAVPEPATAALLTALVALAGAAARKHRARAFSA